MKTRKEKARAWVNGYAVAGTAAVVAAVFPGGSSLALIAIEGHMCYQIGKIYRGDDYSKSEAVAAAGVIGLAAITGKILALEALNLIPFAGWAAKAAIAGGIIKSLGELVIKHYENVSDDEDDLPVASN